MASSAVSDSPSGATMASPPLLLWLEDVDRSMVDQVGGKNAALGEMIQHLNSPVEVSQSAVRVPGGFCTTALAYRRFLSARGLDTKLSAILSTLDRVHFRNLAAVGSACRQLFYASSLTDELRDGICAFYRQLSEREWLLRPPTREWEEPLFRDEIDCAVRSSATAEDLPTASFAGQQESFLNVSGAEQILAACLRCFASLYTDRAISYRERHGFTHEQVAISIGIQRMVRSDLGSSGVLFTCDPESGHSGVVLISGVWGLGETLVQGRANPDEWIVAKEPLARGRAAIVWKETGSKAVKLVYEEKTKQQQPLQLQRSSPASSGPVASPLPSASSVRCPVREVSVSPADGRRLCLSDNQVLQLARWSVQIESHYTAANGGRPTPMDIEFAVDGSGAVWVVQARPETVTARRDRDVYLSFHLAKEAKAAAAQQLLARGQAIGRGVATGRVCWLAAASEAEVKFKQGDILVAERTDPDWTSVLRLASAIVTATGGRTCHAAILARELGVPAVVGCGLLIGAVQAMNGRIVTVSCAEGDTGGVYAGTVPFTRVESSLASLRARWSAVASRTRLEVTLSNPHQALGFATLPVAGVGLVRLEFTIAEIIRIHPMALLRYATLGDVQLKAAIDALTPEYTADAKPNFFIDKLAQSIGLIAAAFYPRPVVVRFSDFKSNEYSALLGGALFEPAAEANPMLGWRGASRYVDPQYAAAFGLECAAICRVRDVWGLSNVIPELPFCRTPEEGAAVLDGMKTHGLQRGQNGLKVFIMCEIPSNVILADRFCELFDGMSIGSNDLTQLMLGVDRDSERLQHLFDESSPAVKQMIAAVIGRCHANGRFIGLCGQAPSDKPEFALWLIGCGIDAISLSPDSVFRTIQCIVETQRLDNQKQAQQPPQQQLKGSGSPVKEMVKEGAENAF